MTELKGGKATLESCRIFRVFSSKRFREAFTDSPQDVIDFFAEALDAAGNKFSESQQKQIAEWTGLTIDPDGMTEAQRRAEIDRMMRDLDVWERSPEGRRRLGVQASPPRPPPVEVRAKGRRRR